MTTVSATTSTAAPQTATEKKPEAKISSDFETFLKMLTVQMTNQDPLNPIESSDYAVQLATFSSVEQQVQTNDLLRALGTQFGVMGLSQISGWVGMEARSDAPAYFDGSPIQIKPDPAGTADSMVIAVRDATGKVVQRVEMPPTSEVMEWAGTDSEGNPYPEGLYSFELENYAYGEFLSTGTVESYSPIIEARADAGKTVLVLKGGAEVEADSVTALRDPLGDNGA